MCTFANKFLACETEGKTVGLIDSLPLGIFVVGRWTVRKMAGGCVCSRECTLLLGSGKGWGGGNNSVSHYTNESRNGHAPETGTTDKTMSSVPLCPVISCSLQTILYLTLQSVFFKIYLLIVITCVGICTLSASICRGQRGCQIPWG